MVLLSFYYSNPLSPVLITKAPIVGVDQLWGLRVVAWPLTRPPYLLQRVLKYQGVFKGPPLQGPILRDHVTTLRGRACKKRALWRRVWKI